MNRKNILRIASLMMALLMLCGTLISCGGNDTVKDSGNDGVSTETGDKVLRYAKVIVTESK